MQYHTCKAESHYPLGQNKSITMLAHCNTSPVPIQPAPYLTSSGSSHFGPVYMDLWGTRYCLSPEECQKRIDEGCCLYCSGFNHMAYDCLNKPKESGHPLHGAVAKTATQPEYHTPLRRYIKRIGILTSNDSSHKIRIVTGYP
jgi:hypothetical protein